LRDGEPHKKYLQPDSCRASQQLGRRLLDHGSAGVVYPQRSPRRRHLHGLLPPRAGWQRTRGSMGHVYVSRCIPCAEGTDLVLVPLETGLAPSRPRLR
jgi:hypothetical protein